MFKIKSAKKPQFNAKADFKELYQFRSVSSLGVVSYFTNTFPNFSRKCIRRSCE